MSLIIKKKSIGLCSRRGQKAKTHTLFTYLHNARLIGQPLVYKIRYSTDISQLRTVLAELGWRQFITSQQATTRTYSSFEYVQYHASFGTYSSVLLQENCSPNEGKIEFRHNI